MYSSAFIDASDPRPSPWLDHVHLDLGYFGLRGYHLHKLLTGFHSIPSIRTDVPSAGDVSIVHQSDHSCCYRYDCRGIKRVGNISGRLLAP